MAYQETTTTGYGTRLKNSLGGIGTGFLLFVAGTALLWWNEGRAVKTDKMLNEAEGVTVEMEDVSKIDPEFEGKLVHATAFANTTDSLSDPNFNVGATAIGIQRKVEYFQWVEHASSQSRKPSPPILIARSGPAGHKARKLSTTLPTKTRTIRSSSRKTSTKAPRTSGLAPTN